MRKEEIKNLIIALEDDYLYFKSVGDIEAALDCLSEIDYYLDKMD
jgi:hypothetical protein